MGIGSRIDSLLVPAVGRRETIPDEGCDGLASAAEVLMLIKPIKAHLRKGLP